LSAAAPAWPANAFWDFSLGVYAMPGVEAACLALQDESRLDVNMVLLAAWAAATGRPLDAAVAAQLRALSEPYQRTVMQPLREARRGLAAVALGAPLDALAAARRRRLKQVELDCERLEQLALAAALLAEPAPAAAGAGQAPVIAERFRRHLALLYPGRPLPEGPLAAIARAAAAADATSP